LARQNAACKQYAEEHEGRIVMSLEISGGVSRHGMLDSLLKLLVNARMQAGDIDAVLIYSVERVTRNQSDRMMLRQIEAEQGIRFISVTERA
jgi:DNA invertase Pin-like site-specific DNA recombinase